MEYGVSKGMTDWSDLNLLCERRVGEFLLGKYSEAIIVAQQCLSRPIKSFSCHSLNI